MNSSKPLLNKKLVLIGPKTGIKGGAQVSFNHLLNELTKRGVEYTLIDMPGGNYSLKRLLLIFKYLIVFASTIKKNSIVSLHASDNSAIVYTILLDFYVRLTDSKLLIRIFGGQHITVLKSKNSIVRNCVLECYRRHTLLLQTKQMINQIVDEFGLKNVRWFPTSRVKTEPKSVEAFNQKGTLSMLYVGQIRETKGTDRILKLAQQVEKEHLDAKIELYGEVFDEKYIHAIQSLSSNVITYGGILTSREVYDKMRESDLLLFPTQYEGEGYPGVIVEAIHTQLPVLATDMTNIRDLISDGKEGLLFELDEPEAFWLAFEKLYENRNLLIQFHKNLAEKRDQFSSEYWNGEFFESLLNEL